MTQYPKYVSHKEVSAVKIATVGRGSDGSLLLVLEGEYPDVVIPHQERLHKPHPDAGWYLLVYGDGYVSFSPGGSFEAGYTAMEDLIERASAPAETFRRIVLEDDGFDDDDLELDDEDEGQGALVLESTPSDTSESLENLELAT